MAFEQFKAEPDMENRDPNNLNDHLAVSFEDVIGEPEHTKSLDCVWKFSFKCFNLWKAICYIIASTLCGICAAANWGCYFACVAYHHIWELTPLIRAIEINVKIIGKLYSIFIHACCDPLCEACSLCFNAFKK